MTTTMTETTAEPVTATMTDAFPDPEKEYEIVDGQPEEKSMAGARHGGVGTRLLIHLGWHVAGHNLGCVYGADTAFEIGANVRIPDCSFISAARLPADGEPDGRWPIPPDLAVEIISPTDIFVKVRSKIYEYLASGVKQVWIVEPDAATVTVYRSPTDLTIFSGEDELTSDDLLTGFRLPLGEIFRLPAKAPDETKQG